MDNPSPTHLSLCSGYEGIGLGLKRVFPSSRALAYVEIEAFACANLVAKMEAGELDQAPIWTNLKTFDGKPFRGLVDILSGGFPCQPFSTAGLQKGDEDPRHLFPSILSVIQDTRPRVVFLENVEGIISAKLKRDNGSDPASTAVLLHVCRELERRGYQTAWGVFSAEEVGAPHQRKRVFILAKLANTDIRWKQQRRTEGMGRKRKLDSQWPSRPREPQHEWEEARVMGDSNGKRQQEQRSTQPTQAAESQPQCTGGKRELLGNAHSGGQRNEEPRDDGQVLGVQEDQGQEQRAVVSGGASGELGNDSSGQREAESELGGATDGTRARVDATANRLDRLRLLGNGVVVSTAEVALRTLLDELNG